MFGFSARGEAIDRKKPSGISRYLGSRRKIMVNSRTPPNAIAGTVIEHRPGRDLAPGRSVPYTLAMASNYNSVPRAAAVLVADGEARVIRKREAIDDLLALEPPA